MNRRTGPQRGSDSYYSRGLSVFLHLHSWPPQREAPGELPLRPRTSRGTKLRRRRRSRCWERPHPPSQSTCSHPARTDWRAPQPRSGGSLPKPSRRPRSRRRERSERRRQAVPKSRPGLQLQSDPPAPPPERRPASPSDIESPRARSVRPPATSERPAIDTVTR